MRGWGFSFILGIILSVSAWAGGLPGDDYFKAQALFTTGQTLAQSGAREKALSSFVDARRLLEGIEHQFPHFNQASVKGLTAQIDKELVPLATLLGINPQLLIKNAPPKPQSAPRPVQGWERELAKMREAKNLAERKTATAEHRADLAKTQLREALAARPKSADPKLYAKVQGEKEKLDADLRFLRNQALRSEQKYLDALRGNHRLKEEIARLRAQNGNPPVGNEAAWLRRIRELEAENQRLKSDNEQMRKILTTPPPQPSRP